MKKINACLVTIMMLFSMQIIQGSKKKEGLFQVMLELKKTFPREYSLHFDYISPFFSSDQIAVVKLTTSFSSKAIEQFQPPLYLTQKEYPRFSQNSKFLLILSATWSPTYQTNPTKFEWHLFDLQRRKTIKKFPQEAYPQFDDENNQIICAPPYKPFPLGTKQINAIKSWLYTKPEQLTTPAQKTTTPPSGAVTIQENTPYLLKRNRLLSRAKTTQHNERKSKKEKEEKENNEEELFSSVIEESMYKFKTYINNNERQNASLAIDDIITELALGNEEGTADNQTTVIENYRKYPPKIQKLFIITFLERYNKQTQDIKSTCAEELFSSPYGDLYNETERENNKIENKSNNVTAKIESIKINNQDQNILTITSMTTQDQLLKYPLMQKTRAKAFSPSGKSFVLSYEKLDQDTLAPLTLFTQTQNKNYIAMHYSRKNSAEIFGLLFIDDFTLLTLDKNYSMSAIDLPRI